MRLRIEPCNGQEQHVIRAPNFCGLISDSVLFKLVLEMYKEKSYESDFSLLFSTYCESINPSLKEWFDQGWGQALWLHVAPNDLSGDANDPTGEFRDEIIKSYLEKSAPPTRIKLMPTGNNTVKIIKNIHTPDSKATQDDFIEILKRLSKRRTTRYFRLDSIPCQALEHVLNQITQRIAENRYYETSKYSHPRDLLRSYGCWLEIGIVIFNVLGLIPGLYRFDIIKKQLELLVPGDYRNVIHNLIWNQPAPLTASYTITLFVDFAQARWRYRHHRALRNIFIELGRIGQDIIIAGQQVGLSSFTTPAIKETEFSQLFGTQPFSLFPAYTISQGP